jgi:transposase
MMGTRARLFAPIAAVSLDELVPPDNFYRQLGQALDLSFVRELVRDHYAAGLGRPSVDPAVFFKLQLVMFFEGIRSERALLRLAADRLSVRWYLGFNLGEALPDHSSLSRIRARYGLEVFRRFFDAIVEQCQQEGLVWGCELYFDATQVQADASLDSLTARFAVEARQARAARQPNETREASRVPRQAVEAHLTALFSRDEATATEVDATSTPTSPRSTPLPADPLASAGPADSLAPTSPILSPLTLSGGLLAELETTNAARHDWIAQEGRQRRDVHGRYQRTADVRISTTDPDATPMRRKGGGTHLGYQTHYVVDGGKRRIILGVLVTPGEVMENQPMLDLLWHVRFRWKLWPRQVTGDTKYGTIENIQAIEDIGLRAYMPLPDWEHQRPYFGPGQFTYEAERDAYVCPQGQLLHLFRREYHAQKVEYRADSATCNVCPLKAQCTPSDQGRVVHRHFAERYLERVRAYHLTPAYAKAMRKRQVWVEPLFAEAKGWHGLRRFRLRRLWRVNSEALMIAAGQNLKRLLAKRGWGRRPLPSGAAFAVAHVDVFVVCFVAASVLVAGKAPQGTRYQTPTRCE